MMEYKKQQIQKVKCLQPCSYKALHAQIAAVTFSQPLRQMCNALATCVGKG